MMGKRKAREERNRLDINRRWRREARKSLVKIFFLLCAITIRDAGRLQPHNRNKTSHSGSEDHFPFYQGITSLTIVYLVYRGCFDDMRLIG